MKFIVFYLQLINSLEGLGMFFSPAVLIKDTIVFLDFKITYIYDAKSNLLYKLKLKSDTKNIFATTQSTNNRA